MQGDNEDRRSQTVAEGFCGFCEKMPGFAVENKKREIREGFHAVFFLRGVRGLLAAASVAAHELIDTTGGIDELALTGVEGV